ncbi:GNAT family N-acetyltransferase [Bacillus nakamurai]|uniref:GNAT family N-acetyltransferase n=1 Tax=Bacillus nakamurai TaxID=1793963 RepID=UPI0020C3B62C|nr:GNAT family N-acetyltransferase [Bacillus nakamurai]
MTDQFAKTEKQYIELTSGVQRFDHYSVYADPLLPQIFSHNFIQLHHTFPLDSLLPFFPSVPNMLHTNYIHVKASPLHTFPLILKQTLVKQGFVVEDELFFARGLEDWKQQAGHPLAAWGTEKSLADGSSIMNIYDALYIGEAAAEQKLQRKYPLYKNGTIMLVVCYSDASRTIPIGCGELFMNKEEKTAKIEEVAILDQFQRKGYGKILMSEMMAAAKLNGMETVYLVASGMDGVNGFYEKLGFKRFRRMHTIFHYFLT